MLELADQAAEYLAALFASARGFVDVRVEQLTGMNQHFLPAGSAADRASEVAARAAEGDVYVGVLARARRSGGRRDLIGAPRVVWADCDGQRSVDALRAFPHRPSLIVASGSGPNVHAYWLLRHAETLAQVEHANRRLAAGLGADERSVDMARILRVAGTLNHKHRPPAPVSLLSCAPLLRYSLARLMDVVPQVPRAALASRSPRRALAGNDVLRTVAPEVYVERLTGQAVPRSRKVRCPLHDDHTPSLHVYADPAQGWFCFGCRRGGTQYDLAAALWQRPLRGPGFAALRTDLEHLLLS